MSEKKELTKEEKVKAVLLLGHFPESMISSFSKMSSSDLDLLIEHFESKAVLSAKTVEEAVSNVVQKRIDKQRLIHFKSDVQKKINELQEILK